MSGIRSIDTNNLVSSKENIQPLRNGRDTSILCTALQAENDSELHQELERQRNEFEIRLRSNATEDPLSDWCEYIHWIEQSFPKQGREGKLNVVLRKCINKFKDCDKYKNDVRFLKLCIKYADLEENTIELLSQMHRHGIGVSCAELYITWAEKYAVDNCFKKANAIYEKGLQCQAQPLELLKAAHQNFQAFLVRKMLNEGEIFQPTALDSNLAETRHPYNVLQPVTTGHKEVVPNVRIGQNILGAAGKLQQIGTKESKPKHNKMIKIYEDSENNHPQTEPKAKMEKVLSKKAMTKENIVKPGPWTNKQNKNVPFTVESLSALPFQVHRDENDEENEKKPRNVPSSVLKSHKLKSTYEDENFENAPLFYPEPYDPTKVSMYCKEQIYAGGLEFQFEELRAIQFRRNREELIAKKMSALKLSSSETLGAVSEENAATPSTVKECSFSKSSCKKSVESSDKEKLTTTKSKRKSLFCAPLPSQIEVPKANSASEQENLPSTDYSMNQTIHTKEALSEMQQLWFSKPASPVPLTSKAVKPAAKSILKPSKPCFSLYVDESCLDNLKNAEIPEKPLDLTLKSDSICENENLNPASGVRKKTRPAPAVKPQVENCKENVFIQENLNPTKKLTSDLGESDEDKENGIPSDYCGPIGKSNRKVSGILTPAENVEIAPLSDEEIEVDEDEAPNDSSIMPCNATEITETWNFTKGFQFPRGESTPNVRKSILKKEDVNESHFIEGKNNCRGNLEENAEKPVEINEKTIVLHSASKKQSPAENDNFTKNLSIIAESSREYRSSSSGSSGITSLPLRPSKSIPYTPSQTKSIKLSLTTSQVTLHKTKVQSYTGYEASGEFSQTLKTPTANKLNLTYDLIHKLNAIESGSISCSEKEEVECTAGVKGKLEDNEAKEEKIDEIIKEMSALGKKEEKEEEIDHIIEEISTPGKKDETEEETDQTTEEMSTLGKKEEKEEEIDPFNDELLEKLLKEAEFPKDRHWNGYILFGDSELPTPRMGSTLTLGPEKFDVKKVLGEGSYARIFKLLNTRNGEIMIGKYQKPAFPWEFYITREIQSRIKDEVLALSFMDVESAYFFKNCSILLTRPVEYGDLLSVINKMKQANMICQSLALYFTCQILKIIETLHSCKIIHGDVKPDNFLLRNCNNNLQLQLIDFGRSIDMSLFPEGIAFKKVVTTDGFTTTEMRSGRPWTYQIDLYGVANCGHCLLFGDYMKVVEKRGVWNISKIIHRYWAKDEWKNFFQSLINVESCSKLPNLSDLKKAFEVVLQDCSEIEFSLSKLKNLLNDR